ncbi:MAG: radical SAM protein [Candidatus Hermodarchaeota archaeon]
MLVTSVDFLLTFKCTAECQHCSYKAGPNRTGFIKKKEVSGYLKELTKMNPLKSVWVHGGEPFLDFDGLIYIIKEANQLGIPRKGVITNCYWAKGSKATYKKLIKLKTVGLTSLTFSADFFHQQFIPLEYVRNALQSALSIGFENTYVDSYFVNDVNTDNYFNHITKINLELMEEIEGVEFHSYPMSVEGRAVELIEHIKLKKDIPSGNCPVPFWIDGDLENPATFEIDGEGNVTLCPGICIGNTNIQSLTKIIKNYDINNHPILSIIYEEGPIGLLKIAKENGFQQKKQYANECHLCYELRSFLQEKYPYSLAPKECY